MTADQKRIQQGSIDWMMQHKDAFTHSATLTLKSYRRVEGPRGQGVEMLTHIEAKRNFTYFVKRLNVSLLGKAAKRFGKSVSVIPVLEGQGTNKLLHYHCAIGGVPEHVSTDMLRAAIHATWTKTPFGNDQIDVKPIISVSWFSYMCKEIGIANADVIDWENVEISSAPTLLV